MTVKERNGDAPTGAESEVARPPRTIGRKIGLPSGRAVVGALLVTIAVVGLFATARRSQDDLGSPYVVVAETISAGEQIQEADLVIRNLDIGELADRTLTSKSQAVGSVAVQTLMPGQLLQQANILLPSPGESTADSRSFEVTFSIDQSRALGGNLLPGELVDVVATLDGQGVSCATVVVPKARVVRVGDGTGQVLASRTDLAVTLAVNEDESVLGLVFAVDEADVTIVRSTRAQGDDITGTFCGDTLLEALTVEATT